jgi:hypothetical protein
MKVLCTTTAASRLNGQTTMAKILVGFLTWRAASSWNEFFFLVDTRLGQGVGARVTLLPTVNLR